MTQPSSHYEEVAGSLGRQGQFREWDPTRRIVYVRLEINDRLSDPLLLSLNTACFRRHCLHICRSLEGQLA
jgi:hypothetical protein